MPVFGREGGGFVKILPQENFKTAELQRNAKKGRSSIPFIHSAVGGGERGREGPSIIQIAVEEKTRDSKFRMATPLRGEKKGENGARDKNDPLWGGKGGFLAGQCDKRKVSPGQTQKRKESPKSERGRVGKRASVVTREKKKPV